MPTVYVATRLHLELTSEFIGQCFVVGGLDGCSPVVLGTPGDGAGCTPGTPASAVVPRGDHAVFVATSTFDGVPCDVGFNEYRVTISSICDGDTNADQVVDVVDLVNVIVMWDTSGISPFVDADIDNDGNVNCRDLCIVCERWGDCFIPGKPQPWVSDCCDIDLEAPPASGHRLGALQVLGR